MKIPSYAEAKTNAAGLMSATDKKKVDAMTMELKKVINVTTMTSKKMIPANISVDSASHIILSNFDSTKGTAIASVNLKFTPSKEMAAQAQILTGLS